MYFHVCETQSTRMHVTDSTATPNGHQMAVVTWDRSIICAVPYFSTISVKTIEKTYSTSKIAQASFHLTVHLSFRRRTCCKKKKKKNLNTIKVWGVITYPFLNFNGTTVEV